MGKKRISALGSEAEDQEKTKKAVKLEQKKLREGKSAKSIPEVARASGLKGGQRVVDTAAQSLVEFEAQQAKQADTPTEEAKTFAVASSSKKTVHIRSKAYHEAKLQINSEQTYPLKTALDLLKKVSLTKFDPTVELHIMLKSGTFNQNVELPFTTGKTKRIAVADDSTIAKIESGKIDFDVLLASPSQMAKLVKFAKTLGPKGLMPNPKTGTVVADPEATAKTMSKTISITLKTEKSAPVIHTIVGKLSQPEKELTANVETILKALTGNPIIKIVIKSTMSPAIKLLI